MTPPKIFGKSSDSLVCLPEPAPVCEAPVLEEQVCRADEFSFSPVLASTPQPSLRALFHERAADQLAASRRGSLVASAFGSTSAPRSTSAAEGVAASPLGFFNLMGCANEGAIDNAPDPDPVEPPPNDNPPVLPGGQNGGLGAGIQTMFASSACRNPLDLDLASAAGSVILTCGDDTGTGNGILEIFNAASGGSPTVRSLPAFLGGSMSKPIRLTSSATGDGGIIYAGFRSSRSDAQLESETHSVPGVTASMLNSGIYTTNEAGTGTVAATSFDAIEWRDFSNHKINISLAGLHGGDTTVTEIQPNNPVSLLRLGNRVIVLNNTRQINPVDGRLDYAPASVHRFTINPSTGALVSETVPSDAGHYVKPGTNQQGNGLLLDGTFNVTALGAIDSNRFGVVVQGLPGMNSSGIHIYNAETLEAGLPEDPDRSGSYISFADAPDAANPGVDFVANDSAQLAVVGNRYALVGSFDGTGRIAMVDCNSSAVAPGANRVRYIRIFDDGSDIANIVPSPAGDFAYVISDSGKIRAVTLAEGPNFGRVGDSFNFVTAPDGGATIPAIYAADSVIAAHDRAISKAPIATH